MMAEEEKRSRDSQNVIEVCLLWRNRIKGQKVNKDTKKVHLNSREIALFFQENAIHFIFKK
jgi:hypothetical protein